MKIKKLAANEENKNKYFQYCKTSKLVRSNINYGRIGLLADADVDG